MQPKRMIRRFDVFAEYRKQEQEDDGMPEEVAKGYGLWVAKVVAARRFGGPRARDRGTGKARDGRDEQAGRATSDEHLVDGKWHALEGEPQTDELFDREIVQRMGEEFYREVFVPAIRAARERGESYEAIRDAIRKDWKRA